MKYTNQYFEGVVLNTTAQVKELQATNPDPRNFFWILSDLTVDTEVSETNDYNDLDNKPDLFQYISVGAIDSPLPELIRTTDNITCPSIRIAIRDNPHHQGFIKPYIVPSKSFVIPRDGVNNYVCVRYNNGSPEFVILNNNDTINNSDIALVWMCWNVAGPIHSLGLDNKGEGLPNKIDNAIFDTTPYRIGVGHSLTVTEVPTRYINVTQATVYAGTVPIDILQYNSQTDSVIEVYHSAGVWTYNIVNPGGSYNNLLYDDGTNLVVAGNNKYVVRWIYRTIGDDKEIFVVYGNAQYNTIAGAQTSVPPNVPNIVSYHGLLVGRVIIEKGASAGFAESVQGINFSGSPVTNHNDLAGIQGGAPGDYQHVTQDDIDRWDSVSYYVHTQSVASNNWTFANPLQRRCNVDLYDSANNKFYAEVLFSSDNLTVTVSMNRALIGTAVLG